MSTTIDLADAAVVFLVASGASYLIGTRVGRREKAAAQEVQPRRARRLDTLDLRHRAEPDEDEQGTDTTVDEPAEQTARQRMTGIAMTPAAGMRGEARVLRQETREIRVISDELFIGAGMREVFAEVYGEEQVRLPLYESVVSEYETGQYPMVRTRPDTDQPVPSTPPGPPTPQRLVEHDGQSPERAAAARLMHLAAVRDRPGAGDDSMPVPTTPVPTSLARAA